jgi:hypothetical protein
MRRSKYGAKPTTVDGVRFASMKEARRYRELKMLRDAGHVQCLELQPRFDIYVTDLTVGAKLKATARAMRGLPRQHDMQKVCTYVADFRYQERMLKDSENNHWRVVVEDVKGVKTPVYRLKKKLVEAQYGIEIREV